MTSKLERVELCGDEYIYRYSVAQFIVDPDNVISSLGDQGKADVLNLITDQLDTDDLVEDGFRDALVGDAYLWDEDLSDEDADDLLENLDEIMDLCDICEAYTKGYILD